VEKGLAKERKKKREKEKNNVFSSEKEGDCRGTRCQSGAGSAGTQSQRGPSGPGLCEAEEDLHIRPRHETQIRPLYTGSRQRAEKGKTKGEDGLLDRLKKGNHPMGARRVSEKAG